MEIYRNILIEYSLIGIVNLHLREQMTLEIEDLSKNVRKTQDRTS